MFGKRRIQNNLKKRSAEETDVDTNRDHEDGVVFEGLQSAPEKRLKVPGKAALVVVRSHYVAIDLSFCPVNAKKRRGE